MVDNFIVFISYVEEDAEFGSQLSSFLSQKATRTWHYKKDSLPGLPYITQIRRAIIESTVVAPLISATTILKPQQVNAEIVYAFQNNKSFLPILIHIEHKELQDAQPDWPYCFGASTSIRIESPNDQVALAKIEEGLRLMREASTMDIKEAPSDRKLLISFLGRHYDDISREVSSPIYTRFRVPASIDWYGFTLTSKVIEARGGDLEVFDDCFLLQFIDNKVTSACFVKRVLQFWFDPMTGRPKLEFVDPIISVGSTIFDKQVSNPCILDWV
jgi:hypothetical protein